MICKQCKKSYEPIKKNFVITKRDGIIQPCRFCLREYKNGKAKKSRENTVKKEKQYESTRQYKQRNQEVIAEKYHIAYWSNPQKFRDKSKTSYYKYHETNKQKATIRAKKDKDKRKHYVQTHPEIAIKCGRNYRKRHPDRYRTVRQAQRARKLQAEGIFSESDIRIQYKAQSSLCFYCHRPLNGVYHIDHVIPLSRNGTNWPSNLVCACAHCNLSKSNKIFPNEWSPISDDDE